MHRSVSMVKFPVELSLITLIEKRVRKTSLTLKLCAEKPFQKGKKILPY